MINSSNISTNGTKAMSADWAWAGAKSKLRRAGLVVNVVCFVATIPSPHDTKHTHRKEQRENLPGHRPIDHVIVYV